jgi:hypothetical protein
MNNPSRQVRVFLTVDTEVWPKSSGWPHTPLAGDYDCSRDLDLYLYGGTGESARGLAWQLRTIGSHGLKATYFVDPLFSFALGVSALRDVVAMIRQHKQEIGLHLHPEWLNEPGCVTLPAFSGPLLHAYMADDQCTLVRAGLDRLAGVGAGTVDVFRAGSWGADRATISAVRRNGLRFDSSLNARFAASFPDIDGSSRYTQTHPFMLDGIWEFPVTNFVDKPPSGWRPLHVCASSFGEMRMVLEFARDSGWYCVVIVLHSFEFVRTEYRDNVVPQRLLVRRFERLCQYLADNADQYETCHFADIDESTIPLNAPLSAAVSSRLRTVVRQVQQLVSRVY